MIMPIDIRFDDLDLRVEPPKGAPGNDDLHTYETHLCTHSNLCTAFCCTDGI
jgi:hypothetical protein